MRNAYAVSSSVHFDLFTACHSTPGGAVEKLPGSSFELPAFSGKRQRPNRRRERERLEDTIADQRIDAVAIVSEFDAQMPANDARRDLDTAAAREHLKSVHEDVEHDLHDLFTVAFDGVLGAEQMFANDHLMSLRLRAEHARGVVNHLVQAHRGEVRGSRARGVEHRRNQLAACVVCEIERGGKDSYLGWPEKFFVRLNSISPRLVDGALIKQSRRMNPFANDR